ncbi:toll/interleukin-1 receptor domain-containing protein [Flavobacterium hydrophilum]|uniref:TIR domain-containing protein n=1 Tax=Flavobacterium hydrophilum TaxID=2211445 RepID=A0A2V4C0P3_9FLAO|nr:toll/interleukin-1 receptor domain-containing protein [Flavobacterium hydrophilum]PXY43673.1 hypothetical protein DMB68_19000 [Flavobacterium hydrophilum]
MEFTPKEYDFFISHASEDKENFVRPLANELIQLGFKIWYDELTLKLGDSLFEEISNGIKKSNFGIVVISKNFLKKEWTKKELNGLINKEIFTSNKVILPVWLDITAKEIFDFSPILADKVSVSVKNDEINKVISQVLSITKSEIIGIDLVKKKINFLNNCNDDERKKYLIDTETRIKNLVYFEEAYYNWFCSDDAFGGEEWDDFLAEKKRYELQNAYNLPYNVTYNPEFESGYDMNLIIRLAKKWILKKATVEEINELIFLVDWYHELDLPYILWGFTDESLEDFETHDLCFLGAYQIKSSKRITTSEQIENAAKKVFSRYYGKKINN